jgi:hypothetical protein
LTSTRVTRAEVTAEEMTNNSGTIKPASFESMDRSISLGSEGQGLLAYSEGRNRGACSGVER